mmetsp:Transcript_37545/g.118422  ORF Transcript_37545/g.118422 Transcript_37545/m.118422 type:complete len:93 (+) Transcript_37545:617-895(+)
MTGEQAEGGRESGYCKARHPPALSQLSCDEQQLCREVRGRRRRIVGLPPLSYPRIFVAVYHEALLARKLDRSSDSHLCSSLKRFSACAEQMR